MIDLWRRIGADEGLSPEIIAALEVRLLEIIRDRGPNAIRDDAKMGVAAHSLIRAAIEYASDDFRKSVVQIKGENDWCKLPRDRDAQRSITKWERRRNARLGGDAQKTVVDFSDDVLNINKKMEARDSALRVQSTDFGNFVADAIKSATEADMSLINSGSFRIDSTIQPNITKQDIWDTFIYDGADAIVQITLKPDEIRKIAEHAMSKVGQGGFLQISERYADMLAWSGDANVAIVKYLLSHPGDGYQEILTTSRCCTVTELLDQITPRGGIGELIYRGADNVQYSAEFRIGGKLSAFADDIGKFIGLTDLYLECCKRESIVHPTSLHYLDPLAMRPQAPAAIRDTRQELRNYAQSLVIANLDDDIDKFLIDFATRLADCRPYFQNDVPYDEYFDAALRYDWALRHIRAAFD